MKRGPGRPPGLMDLSRAEMMAEMYRDGLTLHEIGERFTLTRERVRQVLSKLGVTRFDGGQIQRALGRKLDKHIDLRERNVERYGCTLQQRKAIGATARRRYIQHRRNNTMRGIEWNISLWDWWQFWQQSGKYDQIGKRREGLCLSRKDKTKPYTLDNLKIIQLQEVRKVE